MKDYTQLCVLEGILSKSGDGKDIIPQIEDFFKIRAKFADYVTTLPDKSGPGGRKD